MYNIIRQTKKGEPLEFVVNSRNPLKSDGKMSAHDLQKKKIKESEPMGEKIRKRIHVKMKAIG